MFFYGFRDVNDDAKTSWPKLISTFLPKIHISINEDEEM